jgi:hypothetical protein
VSMWRYPTHRASATASVVTSGGVWNTPSPTGASRRRCSG